MEYQGHYINLERNPDRRQSLEAQLAACNLQAVYQRHAAADGNTLGVNASGLSPGAIGCFTSHYLLLRSLARTPATRHTHIIEDDIVLSPSLGGIIDSVINSGLLAQWDLLYTDVWIPPYLLQIRELNQLFARCTKLDTAGRVQSVNEFTLLNLKKREFASTVSYIVNANSIPKVARMLEEACTTGLTLPIDIFYRQKVQRGELTAACLFPFVTTINVEQNIRTNIADPADAGVQNSRITSTILRNLYFIHSDPQQLLNLTRLYLGDGPRDPRGRVAAEIVRFAITPEFRLY